MDMKEIKVEKGAARWLEERLPEIANCYGLSEATLARMTEEDKLMLIEAYEQGDEERAYQMVKDALFLNVLEDMAKFLDIELGDLLEIPRNDREQIMGAFMMQVDIEPDDALKKELFEKIEQAKKGENDGILV